MAHGRVPFSRAEAKAKGVARRATARHPQRPGAASPRAAHVPLPRDDGAPTGTARVGFHSNSTRPPTRLDRASSTPARPGGRRVSSGGRAVRRHVAPAAYRVAVPGPNGEIRASRPGTTDRSRSPGKGRVELLCPCGRRLLSRPAPRRWRHGTEEVVDGRAPAASCGLATRVRRQAGTAPKELVLACHNGGSGSVHQKFVTRQTAWCSGALTVRPILCLASLEEQC